MKFSGLSPLVADRTALHRTLGAVAAGAVTATAALGLAACGSSGSGTTSQGADYTAAAAATKVDNIAIIGKTDASSGAPGTFTAKSGWAAFDPGTLKVGHGDTVVLTIKEYDDAATPLPSGSPYNAVAGGTETVDGAAVTTVADDQIAHTITIPELGINIPIVKAPSGGVATVVFTFKAGTAGTFTWKCMTPCGDDPNGMGGAMQTDSWMQGKLIVA